MLVAAGFHGQETLISVLEQTLSELCDQKLQLEKKIASLTLNETPARSTKVISEESIGELTQKANDAFDVYCDYCKQYSSKDNKTEELYNHYLKLTDELEQLA